MSSRFIKQFIYGGFFVLILLILGFGIYYLFFRVPPSCFDLKRNQNETGVDCGGPCVSCAIKNARPMEVNFVKILPIGNINGVLIKIANPNLAAGASSFDFIVHAYGLNGAETGSVKGESFIYPGEIKYMVLPDLGNEFNKVADARVEILNAAWQAAENFSKPNTAIERFSTSLTTNGIVVNGVARNGESKILSEMIIDVLLYDSSGNIVGVTRTIINNMMASEEREFSVSFPAVPSLKNVSLSATQIFVEAK